jgi:YihY family inner membrane protein
MRIIVENPNSTETAELFVEPIRRWSPTIRYLSQTEVHVYALAIGASVLLSFFPFLIVMLTIIRDVFHFQGAEHALVLALQDYFPGDLGNFIIRNLTKVNHGRFQFFSVFLLLFTANGIFEPLEVALNRAWGIKENRSYFANQLLSLFLIILCGGMALGSVLLTAANTRFVTAEYGIRVIPSWMSLAIFKLGAVPITIVSLFIVYWILPNRSVPAKRIFPVAVMVGLGLEVVKYLFLLAWPWIGTKLTNEYGPFDRGVSIVIFSLLTSLLVLAGAEWSARPDPAAVQE